MEETIVTEVLSLGKYGTIGVMIALILLCGTTIWMLWKMASNHITHSNEAFNKNTEALTKLIDAHNNSERTIDENTRVLRRINSKL